MSTKLDEQVAVCTPSLFVFATEKPLVGETIVKLPSVEVDMPTTMLEVFIVRESATEPVAMVRVVDGEVWVMGRPK